MGMEMTLIFIGVGVVALVAIGFIFARLYRRSTKEVAFVRTGFGGEKVIKDGGAIVLPVLHETIDVNMQTLRLAVSRKNEEALITQDRMRVDVTAEFYVRVKPDAQSISQAAQTLGARTMNPEALRQLIEGKFIDALRSVAAEMSMKNLHEKRTEFVATVKTNVAEDLNSNGLELESVSLTGLDQTAVEYFNESNVFDAEGLTLITEEVETRKKRRNDIEQETRVSIERKNYEANKESLEIEKENKYAELDQQREIAVRDAEIKATIAKEEAEKRRDSENARIEAEESTNQLSIEQKRVTENARVVAEEDTKKLSIEKQRITEEARIEKERAVREADIGKERAVEIAQQEKLIQIAKKSEEESQATAEAQRALQAAVEEEEKVKTVVATATANRDKEVAIIKAKEEAEKEAVGIKVEAEAEKEASQNRADARTIEAKAEAEAIKIVADGKAKEYEVEAAGKLAINEAENTLSESQIALRIKTALIDALPSILAEAVKPMEKIDSIKILQMDGANIGSGGAGNGLSEEGLSVPDQVTNAALKYQVQKPIIDNMIKELGFEDGSVMNFESALNATAEAKSLESRK